jgi:hypothetical protein
MSFEGREKAGSRGQRRKERITRIGRENLEFSRPIRVIRFFALIGVTLIPT